MATSRGFVLQQTETLLQQFETDYLKQNFETDVSQMCNR
jgi:hypothetical protein